MAACFFVHYRSPYPCKACLCYALGSFLFLDWFCRAFGAKSGFSDRNSPELAHTIPGKFFPYPLIFGQSVSGFRGFMWAPHLSGIDQLQGSHQVRFKCLSTPMRGPNNKPLAFVVHGAHSHELGRALLSAAALVRLTVIDGYQAVEV